MKYPIWYTEKRMTGGVIGWQKYCILAIKPGYEKDEGLYQHELTHIGQWLAMTVLVGAVLTGCAYLLWDHAEWLRAPPWLYGISMGLIAISAHGAIYAKVPEYRFWCEVMAFKRQLRYYPDDRALKFAGFLSGNYNLDVSYGEALRQLRG